MKLTTGILIMAMMAAGASIEARAQSTDAIDQARSIAKSLQQKQANDTNAAAKPAGTEAKGKPAPGAPAPAVKPAAIPATKPVSAAPAAADKAAKSNRLERVNVVSSGDGIQVEMSSSEAVTPKVTKLSSPARVVVELPETVVATSQNRIPVGKGEVKGIRIGMNGKTPPTTSVVVDLEKAIAYDITPGPAGKLVLTLHTQGTADVAKSNPAPAAKPSRPAAESKLAAKPASNPRIIPVKAEGARTAPKKLPAAMPASAPKAAVAKAEAPKLASPVSKKEKGEVRAAVAAKPAPRQQAKTIVAAKASPSPVVADRAPAAKPASAPKPEEKKWAMTGKRDPFFSPVVQQSGSGCSTGKKCLEIGTINVRGVVKSDTGFIAVVTNNLNKAYFLRENDPVFNGYVVKITGDSVTFQETVQDKLGKPFTREVVKRIFTPAV